MPFPDAPGTPGSAPAADQGTDQADAPGTSREDQGAGEGKLFTDQEVEGLAPDLKKRVDGMVANYTRKTQEIAELRKTLEQQLAQAKDQLEMLRNSPVETGQEPPAPAQSKIEELMSRVKPEEKAFLKELVTAIREEVRGDIAPVANALNATRQQSELAQVRGRYKDFDQVVTQGNLAGLLQRHPEINSYEVAYRMLSYENVSNQAVRARQELEKIQADQKRNAVTEMPGGPSGEALNMDDYLAIPKEKRRKMNIHQLAELAERASRRAAT